MTEKWTSEMELYALELRSKGSTIRQIAEQMKSTESAIKHKLRRIGQKENQDRFSHPVEKIEQLKKILPKQKLTVLETHAGFGNLTKFYNEQDFEVLAIEIEREKVEHIRAQHLSDVDVICGDSLRELLLLEYRRLWFDVVDLDPYGYPSRFIPSALRLLNDGFLFMTMPKIGVSQMNKITVRHLESFWGIEPKTKPNLADVVTRTVSNYGFQNSRSVQLLDVVDLGRSLRFAFKVKKTPMTDLVGLKVNRKAKQTS